MMILICKSCLLKVLVKPRNVAIPVIYQITDANSTFNATMNYVLTYNRKVSSSSPNFKTQVKIGRSFKKRLKPKDTFYDSRII